MSLHSPFLVNELQPTYLETRLGAGGSKARISQYLVQIFHSLECPRLDGGDLVGI